MKNSPDPAVHQHLERQMMEHVERLLADERLRVDTTRGRRPVTTRFEMNANELAERRADRTLILVQPNDAGGWTATGPVETKALVDLFDPEAEQQKRNRIRNYIAENDLDLLGSGIPVDKVAAKTQLPLQLVEAEL